MAKKKRAQANGSKQCPPTRKKADRPDSVDAPMLAKLDPTLLWAVSRATLENRELLNHVAARAGGLPASPPSLDGLSLGIHSIATQLAPAAKSEFYQTDRVPTLVAVSDPADVAQKVTQWKGEAFPITTSVLSVLLSRSRLADLAALDGVRYVEASHRLKPHCDLAHASARLLRDGARSVPQTGRGTLVGVVDTGIDVQHPSFWDGDDPRIVFYYDQEKDVAYTADDIRNGQAGNSPDTIGHGTHVAGIAVGNGSGSPDAMYAGVAPDVQLAIVKTTFQSDDIVKAVKRIFDVAQQRQQSCVVNLSLGGHFGGHDGSSIAEAHDRSTVRRRSHRRRVSRQ